MFCHPVFGGSATIYLPIPHLTYSHVFDGEAALNHDVRA
jgi:hypothetical protein